MNTTILLPYLFLLFALQPLGAQTDDTAALKAINAAFNHHFVTNDTVAHSRILHPDFVYVNAKGQTVDRRRYLQDWLHGFDGHRYWDYRAETIRVFGNTALVSAVNKYLRVNNGKEIAGMAAYTDVYVKNAGTWRCVQAQVAELDPAFWPGEETVVRRYDFRRLSR